VRLFLSAFVGLALLAAGWSLTHFGGREPARPALAATPDPAVKPYLRLGFAPEANIFALRKGYRSLADYLEKKLTTDKNAPVHIELVTATSYAGMLRDFGEGRIDAAFMGSLSALVALDRQEGDVYLRSQSVGGLSTYSGVIFVLHDSPCKTFDDLRGKRLGAVRTTMGGAVYPLYLMNKYGMLQTPATQPGTLPQLVWSGTHDDVINEVVSGHLDAGAVKDLRFLAYQKEHPQIRFRKLAESPRVPDNALVIRRDYPAAKREALVSALESIHADPAAKPALAAMRVERYLPCDISQYQGLYEMVEGLGSHWSDLNIEGPAPRRPAPGEMHTLEHGEGG
jgi:phosphonate transport system substrate-binding protein